MVIKNKGDWCYGWLDIWVKLFVGQGLWFVIWMFLIDNIYGDWLCSGEIDIMENIGSELDCIFGIIYYGYDGWCFIFEGIIKESGLNFSEEFYVYMLLWNEDCIMMMVDGEFFSGLFLCSIILFIIWLFD